VLKNNRPKYSISAGQHFSKDKELKAAAGGVLKC
jgi:hypothetical protein